MFYARTTIESRELPVPNDTPSASIEPPWWKAPKSKGTRRAPLSRDQIVDAAVKILDRDGLDALTVRRLAEELNTGSATLYWHISGKDELGELVYDRIIGELELPEPDPSRWQEQMKELIRGIYALMLRHNDVVRLSIGHIPVGPNAMRLIEWTLGVLRGAGIPDQAAAYFGDIVGRYIDVSVLEVRSAATAMDGAGGDAAALEMMGQYLGGLPVEQFPNIHALLPAMFAGDDADRFDFGLDLLVRGLAATTE